MNRTFLQFISNVSCPEGISSQLLLSFLHAGHNCKRWRHEVNTTLCIRKTDIQVHIRIWVTHLKYLKSDSTLLLDIQKIIKAQPRIGTMGIWKCNNVLSLRGSIMSFYQVFTLFLGSTKTGFQHISLHTFDIFLAQSGKLCYSLRLAPPSKTLCLLWLVNLTCL